MKTFITSILTTIAIGVFLIALALAIYETAKFLRRHLLPNRRPDQDKR